MNPSLSRLTGLAIALTMSRICLAAAPAAPWAVAPSLMGACQIAPLIVCESNIADEQACAAAGARYHGARWVEEVNCQGVKQKEKKKPQPNGVCHITKDPGNPCIDLPQKACEDAARSRGGAQWAWKQGGTCRGGLTVSPRH